MLKGRALLVFSLIIISNTIPFKLVFSEAYSIPSSQEEFIEQIATDFSVQDVDSGATYYLSDFRGRVVVLDLFATWCGPCKIFAPTFTQAAKKFRTTARFAKLNTEAESELAAQFHIRSIPTLVIMKNCRESTRQSVAMSLVQFGSWLREQIG